MGWPGAGLPGEGALRGLKGFARRAGRQGLPPGLPAVVRAGRASPGDSSPIPARHAETESKGEARATRSAVTAAEAAASLRTKPRAELGGPAEPTKAPGGQTWRILGAAGTGAGMTRTVEGAEEGQTRAQDRL